MFRNLANSALHGLAALCLAGVCLYATGFIVSAGVKTAWHLIP